MSVLPLLSVECSIESVCWLLLTSTDIVGAVLAAVGSQPAGDGIDIDAVTDENALLAHFLGILFLCWGNWVESGMMW